MFLGGLFFGAQVRGGLFVGLVLRLGILGLGKGLVLRLGILGIGVGLGLLNLWLCPKPGGYSIFLALLFEFPKPELFDPSSEDNELLPTSSYDP